MRINLAGDMRAKIKLVSLLLILVVPSLFAVGEKIIYNSDILNVSINESGEIEKLIMSGNVEISYGEMEIMSRRADFNVDTGTVNAEGDIRVKIEENIFTCDLLTYNINERRGILTDAEFSSPNLFGRAKTIEVWPEKIVFIEGYLTGCNSEHPHYRIQNAKVEYVQDEYLRAERLRLVVGKRFTILYIPRYTIDVKTAKPFFMLRPGYRESTGRNISAFFNQRIRQQSDILLGQKVNIGEKGAGAGLGLSSQEKNIDINTIFFKEWSDSIKAGATAQFRNSYNNELGKGNLILDWRYMENNTLFYDFFNDYFRRKSGTYNHFAATQNTGIGIFTFNVRESAGDNRLQTEKMPEISLYTPPLMLGNSLFFLENEMRLTNFRREDCSHIRIADRLTIQKRISAGNFMLKPWLSMTGTHYSGNETEKFNLTRESGISLSTLLTRNYGDYTEYLTPELSLINIKSGYEKKELTYFDPFEEVKNGNFFETGLNWNLWKEKDYRGNVSLKNLYEIEAGRFEDIFLTHDIKISDYLYIEGHNHWNAYEKDYLLGINNVVLKIDNYSYSAGTKYDGPNNSFGVSSNFQHQLSETLTYGVGAAYDFKNAAFTDRSLKLRKKLHCWELGINLSKGIDDYSFYITAFPILF